MPHLPRPIKKVVNNWMSNRTVKKFYSTGEWVAVRAMQIATQPYCAACMTRGVLVDCTVGGHVDHVISMDNGGAPLDLRNLQTLCQPCHAKKSALERHGLELDAYGEFGAKYPTERAKQEILSRL